MAVNNPRNKVFIFRLTQDEYAKLQAASSAQGARSLSDFARAKLLGSAHAPAVEDQLADLKNTVARIAVMLEGAPASAGPLASPSVSPVVDTRVNLRVASINPSSTTPINMENC